jgi:hypothetical protein
MTYRVHVKTEFMALELREILQSRPGVLLGVSIEAEGTLETIPVTTVYDLALARAFRDAAHVVEAATDPTSVVARHGVPPADLIVPQHPGDGLADLPGQPVDTLVAVSPELATALRDTMAVGSVRDLAQWPPYLAAVKLLTEALAPERSADFDREEPADLVPRSGALATHQVHYTSTVLIESKPSKERAWDGGLIDITALSPIGFDDVAFGAVLHFTQSWTPKAVALGQLLHSLPLAPGESTRLTVVDWLRRVAASSQEEQAQAEDLSNALGNSTAISEVTSAVAREFQSGDSVAGSTSVTTSASTSGLLGLLGAQGAVGASFGLAGTYSTSSGTRSIGASALQSIDARTQQNSALARTKRAAIVTEVSESDSETINTRIVVNNNHMHALSMQYYEVVQTWETRTVLDRVERCIFLPMRLLNFRDEQILRRYVGVLADAALDRETRDLLLQLRHTVVLEFPFDRFATAALDQVRAEAGTAVAPRPDSTDAAMPALALAAGVEKRLRLQQLQTRIATQRAVLGSDAAAAVHARQIENYDRADYRWFELDRETVVRGVSWDAGEVSAATLQFADGTTTALTAPDDPTAAQSAQGSLGGGVPLDRLRVLRVSLVAAPGTSPSDHSLVRLSLRVELRGRTTWLDASFVASRSEAVDVTVLQAHAPVDVADVASRLMAEQLHYSQAIWMRADRQSLIMQLAPYQCTVGDTALRVIEWMDPAPVTVAGNYLAFPFTYESDDDWISWKYREMSDAVPQVSLVPLPTGGVFGEGVLGEFNSAEKLDVTRYWKWQESPIPNLAPEIAPVQQGQHTTIGTPAVGAAADAVLSMQDPLALPTLDNSDALLKTLMVSNLFNDMSGLDITKGLLKASLDASRDGDLAAAQQANATLKAITDAFGKLVKAGGGSGENLTTTAKGLGSLFNLAGKGGGGAGAGTTDAAGGAIEAGTSGGGSGLGDVVGGGGADAIASVGSEVGSVLEALGPAAAALLA